MLNPSDTDLRLQQQEFEEFFSTNSLIDQVYALSGDIHSTHLAEISEEQIKGISERMQSLKDMIITLRSGSIQDSAGFNVTATGSYIIPEEIQPYRKAAISELFEGVRLLSLNTSQSIDVKFLRDEGYGLIGGLVGARDLHYRELANTAAEISGIDFDENYMLFDTDPKKDYQPEVYISISKINTTFNYIKTLSGKEGLGQNVYSNTRTMQQFFGLVNQITSVNQATNSVE